MTTDAHIHHGFDYVELGAPDLAVTKQFYAAAFGWSFTDYGPPGEPAYVGIRRPDDKSGTEEMGGFDPASAPGAGGVLVLLWSADLDATAAAVRAAGGDLLSEPTEFPGGRRFTFRDPAGNTLGVWGS